MKKIILILMSVLLLLNSCASTGNSNNTESLDEAYDELVFDNETPLDEMEISNVTEFDKRLCVPSQRYNYSSIPGYIDFKNDFEHIYLRQNGDNIYFVTKIMYNDEIYYLISFLVFFDQRSIDSSYGKDGALIYNKLPDISAFDGVKLGVTTFEDIKKIDKVKTVHGGGYSTNHRLKDGRILVVEYKNTGTEVIDKDYIVENIFFEEDKNNFLDKLLPIDREAIT